MRVRNTKITFLFLKVSKGAKIRNGYNQVPHLIQDTKGKVTNSQLDTTNESQEVSPFLAGDRKAHINTHTHKGIANARQKNIKDPQKSTALERSVKYFTGGLNRFYDVPTSPLIQMWIKTHRYLVCMKDP